MKGRPQAAHFAAFPRPPNYRNSNPNAHTNTKEKKLKRILTSVFLVLAVIATVGIFGIQTSDRTEAQTPGVIIHPTVNDGNGVPDIHVELGTSVTIDLADYVQAASSTQASDIDYFLVAANVRTGAGTTQSPYVYSRQIYDPDASQVAPNAPRWLASIATATLSGSELTINPVAVGAARRVHWVADTRADSARDASDASEYETYDGTVAETGAANSRFTVDPKDDFSITVVAAGDIPDEDDFPTTATSGVGADGMDATGAAAAFAATALSSTDDGDDAVNTVGETAAIPVVWTVDNTALSTAYRLVAPTSPSGIVTVSAAGSTGVITITPQSQGTVSIGPIYAVHHLWEDNPADAPAALREKLSDAVSFTVHYATNAPLVRIFKDTDGDGNMETGEPTGGADDPISFDITTSSVGKIGELRSHAGAEHTYTNRNMTWRIGSAVDSDGDTVANFRIDRSGPSHLGKISTGSLVVRDELDIGTYTVRVIAQDAVPAAAGPPEVAIGNSHSVDVTIRVSQANRPPVISQIPASVAIPEITTKVGDTILDLETVTSDPDNQGLTFTLAAKSGQTPAENLGGKVEIATGSSEITLVETVNYEDVDDDGSTEDEDTAAEQPAGYDRDAVRWRGTLTISDGFVTLEKKIAFTVSDEEEAAVVTRATGLAFSINENNAANAVIGDVRIPESTDDGADNATSGYLLVGEDFSDKFALSDAGELTAKVALNHEDVDQYRLTAIVGTNTQLIRSVTVTVVDVNEAPVFNWAPAPTGTATPTPTPTPLGDGVYVASVSQATVVGGAVNYRGMGNNNVPRGAIDPDDGDEVTYSLVAAQDTTGNPITSPAAPFSGPFAINASTGAITVSGRLTAGTTVLYIRATDDDATNQESADVKLTITVTAEQNRVFSINENSAAGTRVGLVRIPAATTGGQSPTTGYDLSSNADGDGRFEISGAGVLTVADPLPEGKTLDYETQSSWVLTAIAAGGASGSVIVNLDDVNEAPEFGFGANPNPDDLDEYVAEVSDTAVVGAAVAAGAKQDSPRANAPVRATDQDAGDVVTYSLVAAQTTTGNPITSPEVAFSGPFAINASTGAITVSGSLDADTTAEYVLWIKATDNDATTPLSDTVKLTITVRGETAQTGLVFSIDENSAAGAVIGTVRIPAATGGQNLTSGYALNSDADGDGRFEISGLGVLTVADPLPSGKTLDHEDQSTWLLIATSGTQNRPVTVNINDVNEAPEFNNGATPPAAPLATGYVARVSESADVGDAVAYGSRTDSPQLDSTFAVGRGVTDDDTKDDTPAGVAGKLTYSLVAENAAGTAISDPEVAFSGPFAINASTGAITVSARLDAETTASYELYVKVTDNDAANAMSDTVKLTITVLGENEPPYFVTGSGSSTPLVDVAPIRIDENTASGTTVATYYAVDPDGDDITFVLRAARDADFFTIDGETGVLTVAAGKTLDYETKASYELELEVIDNAAGQGQILQVINLNNLNDNAPVWQAGFSPATLSINENVLRDTPLVGGVYRATDADGDTITYTLSGPNGRHYRIGSADGVLKTLASLDHETNTSDTITVTASDGLASNNITQETRISIGDVNDRIGSITVKMANPVLGTNGDPNSALADRKRTEALAVPEAPEDLPATSGSAVVNFVETAHAGWGTTLRIEVLAESPGANCGGGNQCVEIELEGDDSDDILKVMAYRNSGKDNLFVAAVMPVQNASMATPGDSAVYKHTDGSVPRIRVDEEDTLRIKFGNLRDSVTIDNEAPEFSNFLPEHEASIDDDEVQYTFTVTDAISGIPDPEDLPDADGDDSYMAVAALVNSQQCHNVAAGVTAPSGTSMVANTNLHEGAQIYCPAGTTPEVRVIVDDKDLDSVTDGYEVDTEVVLSANRISFVTFIACDAAGNCVAFDPDENDTAEALAEITVDTIAPDLSQARTGVMWDAADNKYDDSRNFIQAIFTDLSKLNPDTIEADDFVVDGYTIKRVYWYDDPDTEDENWGTRYDTGSGSRAYREISKTVFIELEEELLPDATPDVSVVPNGLEDEAGKEQDDDEVEADDWIAPKFAVQSITSPLETSRDNVLVGEDQKVTITVTSDERINTTKPLVDVDYVNAPAGCVDRSGIILRAGRDTDGDGRVEPSEARADCAQNAKGASLNSVISKDGTNEWTITVDKPSATGYYNVYIYADDRSSQKNRGSEGVAPADIGTKFFEKDGDVNSDDAVFFEGDVQLPKPQVVVSGEQAGDTEPTVEFKRPLFIEVDFTEPFSADCSAGDKLSNKLECTAESAEYAEDGFDTVTVTRFELNGVDMTDDVKTTDNETFLVALDDVGIGDHELKIQATDVAGNELKDVLEIEFEVEERDPFTRRLNPGWNLVSLPGSPADSAIASVFGSDIEVRTVYTYNPVTPGGWQVAVRETLDDAWQGDLTDITAKSGYWVLSDAIQDLEVSIPRLAGGAVGASTPVQPPVIPMYAGWNLIPVVDVTGDALDTKKSINATTYLNSLDDGLDLARVLGFNTITNEWFTVIDPSDASVTDNLQIGSAYWVFVRESASLVPGGIPR